MFLWHALEQQFAVIEAICSISTLRVTEPSSQFAVILNNDVALFSVADAAPFGSLINQHHHLVDKAGKPA